METELRNPGNLLNLDGGLAQVGWSRSPLLDCNLEDAHFHPWRAWQKFRIKRWDYYAVFTPNLFFSATVADLGYAGNIFVYALDFERNELHEEGLVIPLGKGIALPRNCQAGETRFENAKASLTFKALPDRKEIVVKWPAFDQGRGIDAKITLAIPAGAESMNIVIPIGEKRFYHNHKINCLPASGVITYGELHEELSPGNCFGSLDWGRGVWEYQSYWNWASASGVLPDGRRVGVNLGCGFGDLSKAGENAFILDNKIHKLRAVTFEYHKGHYMRPWKFSDADHRLDLIFTPFKERLARTNLMIITSEVHQMFGRYNGQVLTDQGEEIEVRDLVGFAEEHHAQW